MNKIIRVIISGRVQGVGFRAWTVATASDFGLRGWVRNRGDGMVEAVFSGEEAHIAVMLEACRKGPTTARVDKVESFDWNEVVDESPFRAMPTI